MELYRDVGRFVLRPTLPAKLVPIGEAFVIFVCALFVLDGAIATGVLYLEAVIAEAGHAFPDPVQEEFSFQNDFFAMVILAPIFEEALFRGWLNGQLAALRFAAIAWIGLLMSLGAGLLGEGIGDAAGGAALLLVMIGFVQWLATRHTETQVPGWFKRHFAKLVWGSSLAFGLIHLANFQSLGSPIDLMLVLSQTIGGLVLAYTRTRLGLAAAIGQHAVFNFLVLSDVVVWG